MSSYTRRLSVLLIGFVSCLFISLPVCTKVIPAKDFDVVVKLTSIKAEKTTEQGGDELYFNVTRYSSLGSFKNDRIPAEPACWSSKALDKLKDIVLWEGVVHDKEEIKLILSVVEQEFPPWDPDELIGGAQLILRNKKDKLEHEWVVPVFEDRSEIEMKAVDPMQNAQVFLFKGAGAVYEVAFSIQEK